MNKSIVMTLALAGLTSLQVGTQAQSTGVPVRAGIHNAGKNTSLVAIPDPNSTKTGVYVIDPNQPDNQRVLAANPAITGVQAMINTDPFISFSFSSLVGSGLGTNQQALVPTFHMGDIIKLELGVTITLGSDSNGNSVATALSSVFPGGVVIQATDGADTAISGIAIKTSQFNAFTPGASVSSTQLLAAAGADSPALFSSSLTFVAPYDFTGFGFDLLYDFAGAGSTIGFTGKVTVTPAAVPEPGVMALLFAGGITAGTSLLRRRRNQ